MIYSHKIRYAFYTLIVFLGFIWSAILFTFGVNLANAEWIPTQDKHPTPSNIYSSTLPSSGKTIVYQRFQVGFDGLLDSIKIGMFHNGNVTSHTTYRVGVFSWKSGGSYGLPDTALWQSDFVNTSGLPTSLTLIEFDVTSSAIEVVTDQYFFVVVEVGSSTTCSAQFCLAIGQVSNSPNADNGLFQRCNADFSSCDNASGGVHSNMYGETWIGVFEVSAPTLYSPALPYTSSSTPIRFTTLAPDGGAVTCLNTANSWRVTGVLGGTNSYTTFAVDVEDGANGIECYSTLGSQVSDLLEFDLTYTDGAATVLTPIFDETVPNFIFPFNPARVSVIGMEDGNIWCKKGSGSFVDYGAVLENEKIYFDLDFLDIDDPLVDGLEYTVSCYLETIGGNSDTVQQVYTYKAQSVCSTDFGVSSGDKGLIVGLFGSIYGALSSIPVLGDLIYLDCVIFNDFYSNLDDQAVADLDYHITAFNYDSDVSVPLVSLSSSMNDWLTGSGYSGIKTTVTTFVWLVVLFGLFFAFVFPEIRHNEKADEKENYQFNEIDL